MRFDNIVIPKRLVTRKARMRLVILYYSLEIAAKNAQYVGYAIQTRSKRVALLPEDITWMESFYPSEKRWKKDGGFTRIGTGPIIAL